MRSVTRLSTYPYHPGAGRKKQTRKAHPKQSPSKTGAFFWPPSRQAYFRPLSNNTERAIHISLWNSSFCHIHTRKKKYRIGPVISKSKKHSLNPIPSTIIIVVIHFHPICSEYISPAHTHTSHRITFICSSVCPGGWRWVQWDMHTRWFHPTHYWVMASSKRTFNILCARPTQSVRFRSLHSFCRSTGLQIRSTNNTSCCEANS